MALQIKIRIGDAVFDAELNDGEVAQAVAKNLPLTLRMSRWGDEYYGDCGISMAATEDAREIMEVGELAYWPPGSALCVFFGPTPASTDDKPRAASAVVPIGRISGNLDKLREFGGSIEATIDRH